MKKFLFRCVVVGYHMIGFQMNTCNSKGSFFGKYFCWILHPFILIFTPRVSARICMFVGCISSEVENCQKCMQLDAGLIAICRKYHINYASKFVYWVLVSLKWVLNIVSTWLRFSHVWFYHCMSNICSQKSLLIESLIH